MNEISLLRKILPRLKQRGEITVGPGDDCAAIDMGDHYLLAAVDQLIGGVHYVSETTPATAAGAKLLKRNLSDIAAMGGDPLYALVTVASSRKDEAWFLEFYEGLEKEAEKWDVSICGGDLSGLPAGTGTSEVTTLTILGKVAKNRLSLRSGARPGDLLFCTGCFGNSLNSGHHLDFIPRLKEGEFLAGKYTVAMMDVSDGLLIDACRMATASAAGIELWSECIPLRNGANIDQALTDGEDYELIMAVSPDNVPDLKRNWPFPGVPLTEIGFFTTIRPGKVFDRDGNELNKGAYKGYEHFRD
jgi:thiamine-monophosphate kinase